MGRVIFLTFIKIVFPGQKPVVQQLVVTDLCQLLEIFFLRLFIPHPKP